MKTVVVTGAAGSLGQRVIRLLVDRPDVGRVVGVDVNRHQSEPGVDWHMLDLAGPAPGHDLLAGLVDGADGVLHLAWHAGSGAGDANQRAQRRVLAALDQAGGLPRSVVQVSSATVYGAWADNPVPLTEDAVLRPNPEFAYAVEKAEAERQLAEWAGAHPEVAVAVLRPAVTVGFGNHPLYQALGGTRSPRSSEAGRPVQFLHLDDLASAVLLAWADGLAGVYNVAPDRGIREDTARDLAGGLAKVALPARLARAVASWAWFLWRAGRPKETAAYALYPWVVAADRLMAAGWVPEHTSEEALVETDERAHWDDLPPGRRQNVVAALVALAAVGGVGGVVSAGLAWRARRRRRAG